MDYTKKEIEDLKDEIQLHSKNIPFSFVLLSDNKMIELILSEIMELNQSKYVETKRAIYQIYETPTVQLLQEISNLDECIIEKLSGIMIDEGFKGVELFHKDEMRRVDVFNYEVSKSLLIDNLKKLKEPIRNVIIQELVIFDYFKKWLLKKGGADSLDIKNVEHYKNEIKFIFPGYRNTLEEIDGKVEVKNTNHFSEIISRDKVLMLRNELIALNYIKPISEECFLYWFGNLDTKPEQLTQITWILKNKKNQEASKKSLVYLLIHLGYNENEIRKKINDAFIIDKGKRYIPQNFVGYPRDWSKLQSEYDSEILNIAEKVKLQI